MRPAPQLRRVALAAACAALAGCQFDPSGLAAEGPGGGLGGGVTADAGDGVDGAVGGGGRPAAPICPDDPDLLACLAFDGDATDGSPHQHAVTAVGLTLDDGVRGQAMVAGPGVDVTIGESPILDPPAELTLDVWVRPAALPSTGQRAGLIDNNGQWGLFVHPGGDVICAVSTRSARASAMVAVGEWTRVVCVYDGAELVIYGDGPRITGAAATGAIAQGGGDGTAFGRNGPTGDYFSGLVDEARIWSRAVVPASLCGSGDCPTE